MLHVGVTKNDEPTGFGWFPAPIGLFGPWVLQFLVFGFNLDRKKTGPNLTNSNIYIRINI